MFTFNALKSVPQVRTSPMSYLATCAMNLLDFQLVSLPMAYAMAPLMSHVIVPAIYLMAYLITYTVAHGMASLVIHQTAFHVAHLKAYL